MPKFQGLELAENKLPLKSMFRDQDESSKGAGMRGGSLKPVFLAIRSDPGSRYLPEKPPVRTAVAAVTMGNELFSQHLAKVKSA